MSEQKPSVGCIVHFVYGDQHVPAIITDPVFQDYGVDGQNEPRIIQAMTVFLPAADPFTTCASYDETAQEPGSWHWSERSITTQRRRG